MGVNNLPRVVVRSRAAAGNRTRDLLIASPTPYRCATTPPSSGQWVKWVTLHVTCTIQYNKSINNARMVSRRTESEARVVASRRERWRGAGLRGGTGKIICLKVPVKRGNRRAIANFERDFITTIMVMSRASGRRDHLSCRLWHPGVSRTTLRNFGCVHRG